MKMQGQNASLASHDFRDIPRYGSPRAPRCKLPPWKWPGGGSSGRERRDRKEAKLAGITELVADDGKHKE